MTDIAADILAWAGTLGDRPALVFLAVLLATFILEDAATAAAALLASQGVIAPGVALGALLVGIALGDLGLYGLGNAAARHRWARRWVTGSRVDALKRWSGDRLFSMVFTSRFVPGLRLPTYVAAGFIGADFGRFTLAVVAATLLWTSLLFGAIYSFGTYYLGSLGPWKWAAAAGLAVLVFLVERLLSRKKAETRR